MGGEVRLVELVKQGSLGRTPTPDELKAATEFVGPQLKPEAVEDLLWAVFMLPEFQLNH